MRWLRAGSVCFLGAVLGWRTSLLGQLQNLRAICGSPYPNELGDGGIVMIGAAGRHERRSRSPLPNSSSTDIVPQ